MVIDRRRRSCAIRNDQSERRDVLFFHNTTAKDFRRFYAANSGIAQRQLSLLGCAIGAAVERLFR